MWEGGWEGSGTRVQGLRSRVEGMCAYTESRVEGICAYTEISGVGSLGFRVQGSGFRIQGFEA